MATKPFAPWGAALLVAAALFGQACMTAPSAVLTAAGAARELEGIVEDEGAALFRVRAETVELYAEPRPSAEVCGRLHAGDRITVVRSRDGWWKVRRPADGLAGWIPGGTAPAAGGSTP